VMSAEVMIFVSHPFVASPSQFAMPESHMRVRGAQAGVGYKSHPAGAVHFDE